MPLSSPITIGNEEPEQEQQSSVYRDYTHDSWNDADYYDARQPQHHDAVDILNDLNSNNNHLPHHRSEEEEEVEQQQRPSWPRSYDERQRNNSFFRYYNQLVVSTRQKEWQCLSPMTQHNLIPHPASTALLSTDAVPTTDSLDHASSSAPGRIRKIRSRSFNDYICRNHRQQQHTTTTTSSLILPPLQQQQNQQPASDYGSIGVVAASDHRSQNNGSVSLQNQPTNDDDDNDDGYNIGLLAEMDDSVNFPTTTTTTSLLQAEISYSPPSEKVRPNAAMSSTMDPSPLEQSLRSTNKDEENKYYRKVDDDDDGNPLLVSVLYGAINCTIVIPVVMSFGNIIYRDDAFAPYMPVLVKLTLVSGFVHQVCFSTFSTLKFAVGSVQDAGLIFLSSMAADMVAYCQDVGGHDNDDETMLATVTVGLALATALLGVGLVIIGKLGLAKYVQRLPTCVVAGYLAYIGWFVGYSGLGIMVGASSLTVPLLLNKILFVLPGVAGGIFIYTSVQKFRHVAVLPLCITFLLLAFYAVLALSGSSIEQATENGWIRQTEEAPVWYHTWDYLKIEKVAWGALPQLWLTWSGMLFVVALSSSLDVAAIELEMKQPLDYNRELRMVGISNCVSGMTGGYTGSYIFSQSIFSLRIGIRSRMAGFSLAFFQLLIILVPFPVLSYVPNFFYGSLLSMICVDLMYEWLWEFRSKVTVAEYLVGLSTFSLIHFLGVEYGIMAGVGIYISCRQFGINVGDLKQIPAQEDDGNKSVDYEVDVDATISGSDGSHLGNGEK